VSKDPIFGGGGLTLGSASVISGGSLPGMTPAYFAALRQHELGHTLQFVGVSAFGNPWTPYLVLGSWGRGSSVPGRLWEGLADWLGGGLSGIF